MFVKPVNNCIYNNNTKWCALWIAVRYCEFCYYYFFLQRQVLLLRKLTCKAFSNHSILQRIFGPTFFFYINSQNITAIAAYIREVFKKSKWKFKMAFAMKGGVGSRVPHNYSEKIIFWKPFRIFPWLLKRVLHLVWDSYCVYIVVEVTLNMAK